MLYPGVLYPNNVTNLVSFVILKYFVIMLVSCDYQGKITIWDTEKGKVLMEYVPSGNAKATITKVHWNSCPDGSKYIAAAGRDKNAYIK